MKHTKQITAIFISMLILLFFSGLFAASEAPETTEIRNVIFMIGDGMGINHLRLAEQEGYTLFMEQNAALTGWSRTRSYSSSITDSAAGATALSCGVRINNGQICIFPDERHPDLKPRIITENALLHGMRVGIVTSDLTSGATPSGFSVHTDSRNNTADITEQQLASDFDLIWGAKNGYVTREAAARNGFVYVSDLADLETLRCGERSFGQFASDCWRLQPSDGAPTLAQLTERSISLLDADAPNGFFLMVEGAHIDKVSDNSREDGAVDYPQKRVVAAEAVAAFDNAVRTAVEYAEKDGHTLVIVTADHETGKLYPDEESGEYAFHSAKHSAANVPIFVYGAADLFQPEEEMDNRSLPNLVASRLNWEERFPIEDGEPAPGTEPGTEEPGTEPTTEDPPAALPDGLQIRTDKTQYRIGEEVAFTFAADNAEELYIAVFLNGESVYDINVSGEEAYVLRPDGAGVYSYRLTAGNEAGTITTETATFSVYDSVPQNVQVCPDQTLIPVNGAIRFECRADNARRFFLETWGDERLSVTDVAADDQQTVSFDTIGVYFVHTSAYNEFGHADSADVVITVYDPDCEHEWDAGTVTVPPTCTAEGVRTYTCSICGFRYTEEIPAAGHREVADEGILATCTDAGMTEGSHCEVCGEVLTPREEIPAQGHRDENKDGVCDACLAVLVPTPAVPQNLTAKASADGTITLSWDAVEGATQYNVFRYNGEKRMYLYKGTSFAYSTHPTQYSDRSLSVGSVYYYKVVAVTKTEDVTLLSDKSAAASAMAVCTPDAVSGLSATPSGDRELLLDWNGSAGATHYYIYRSEDGGAFRFVGTDNEPPYADAALTPGVTYAYKLLAVYRAAGLTLVSDASDVSSAAAIGTPDAPRQVTAAPTAANTITLRWSASEGATQYNVYRYNGEKNQYVYRGTVRATAAEPTEYVDAGLYAGITYYYKVIAVKKTAELTLESERSEAGFAKVLAVPAAPKSVAAVPGEGAITVLWTQSGAATQYNIYRYNSKKNAYCYIGTSYGTSYADTAVVAGTTYYYKVVAVAKGAGLTFVSDRSAAAIAEAG